MPIGTCSGENCEKQCQRESAGMNMWIPGQSLSSWSFSSGSR